MAADRNVTSNLIEVLEDGAAGFADAVLETGRVDDREPGEVCGDLAAHRGAGRSLKPCSARP